MHEIPTATFLHISDLHLGKNFEDSGGLEKADSFSKTAAESYLVSGGVRLQTHDTIICAAFPHDIKSAARFVLAPGDKFDLNIITGDISTRADSSARFGFARNFLLADISKSSENNYFGFNFEKERTLCIPGNHDKWAELTPERYLYGFGDVPATPPFVHCKLIHRSGQKFVFIGIDSNLYEEDNKAIGRVSDEILHFLKETFAELEKPAYSDAIKILLLHHHPVDLNRFRKRQNLKRLLRSIWDYERFTRLENADALLEIIRGKVDLIMHGHEHFPVAFYEENADCFIISAGTTTLFNVKPEKINSFHAIAFYDRKFKIVEFDRNRESGFRGKFWAVRKWDGDLDNRGELRETLIKK